MVLVCHAHTLHVRSGNESSITEVERSYHFVSLEVSMYFTVLLIYLLVNLFVLLHVHQDKVGAPQLVLVQTWCRCQGLIGLVKSLGSGL
jgi:hypothetical protein